MNLSRYIAHRGASFAAPENTIAAFRQAQKMGATWVECDVAMTADGVPVIFHDDCLNRTSNGDGKLADKSYAALSELECGSWFNSRFAHEKIPTLVDVLNICQQLHLGINLEIKSQHFNCQKKFLRMLNDILPFWEAGYHDILISSFKIRPLLFFMAHAPQIPRALLMQYERADWPCFAKKLNCFSINISQHIAKQELIQAIKQQGYLALCYTINDVDEAEQLFRLGIDGIFTDQLFSKKV